LLFPTVQFAIFFPLVLAVSWALMPRPRLWKPFITFASYAFYAAAGPRFCLLLAGVTLWNWLAAEVLHRTTRERRRRLVVVAAVAVDLGLLAVFKYYSFFVSQWASAFGVVGLGVPLPLMTIALPVGISFYTFQAISYVVDVKRRHIEPASFLDFAVYLSFFPHLVAGPIVRAREFIPQLARPRDPRSVAVGSGLSLIALGVIKKVVISDFLATKIVDPVFALPQAYHAPDVLLAAYGYTAQIYCDFSGYTDMAIGLALLLGFVLPQNFRSPYRATGFRDFWRRWHMSLSRFLRDDLFVPLGGSRGRRLFTYRNLMITMLLGGLWHGAAWTFVLWGGFHGLGLVGERVLGGRLRLPGWLRWLVTFHLVVFGWILFRATSLTNFWDFLSRLAAPGAATLWTLPVLAAIAVTIIPQLLPSQGLARVQVGIERLHPALLGAGLAVVILVAGATVSSQGVPPFIYFRF
jgi:alginate O-acetyltransferase complex protein AlgI